MKLRDYQEEAVQAVLGGWQSKSSGLVALPTGSGKTVVGIELLKRVVKPGDRTLWLAHRDELIRQPEERIRAWWKEADVGIVKAEENEVDRPVLIGSVQTVHRVKRIRQLLEAGPIDYLVVDEAHHSCAKTYRKIITALIEANPHIKTVGFTATPQRADGESLGKIFETVFYQKSVIWMIQHGYLSPVKGLQIKTDLNFSHIKTRRGDFDTGELAAALEAGNWVELVADAIMEHASDRKTIVFTLLIKQSQALVEELVARGVKAGHVDGNTPIDERRATLSAFKRGDIQVISNAAVLTEGVDIPDADCAAMARPTRSQTAYIQMAGRVLRPWPGKKDALIIDFSDSAQSLIQLPDIGEPEDAARIRARMARFQVEGQSEPTEIFDPDKIDGRGVFAEAIDLLYGSGQNWYISGEEMSLGLGDSSLLIYPFNGTYVLFHIPKEGQVRVVRVSEDPTFLIDVATGIAIEHGVSVLVRRNQAWQREPVSEGQQQFLKKLGFKSIPQTKGDASKLITHALSRRKAEWFIEKRRRERQR